MLDQKRGSVSEIAAVARYGLRRRDDLADVSMQLAAAALRRGGAALPHLASLPLDFLGSLNVEVTTGIGQEIRLPSSGAENQAARDGESESRLHPRLVSALKAAGRWVLNHQKCP